MIHCTDEKSPVSSTGMSIGDQSKSPYMSSNVGMLTVWPGVGRKYDGM